MNGSELMKECIVMDEKIGKDLIDIIYFLEETIDQKARINNISSLKSRVSLLRLNVKKDLIDLSELKDYVISKLNDIEAEKSIDEVYKMIRKLIDDLNTFDHKFTLKLDLCSEIMEKLDISN